MVGAIVPWNFPLQTMAWKLGAALATGCTVVVKPAELTSLSALRFAELVQAAGLPDGVVNIVTGRGSVVGQAMSSHPGIDKLSFTGSTPVGCTVGKTAMDQMKRLTLELGGKSPVIVFADADIEAAAQAWPTAYSSIPGKCATPVPVLTSSAVSTRHFSKRWRATPRR